MADLSQHVGDLRRRASGERKPPLAVAVVAGLVFVVLSGLLIGACDGGFTSTQAGERVVVRNGGPLDNKKVRQIIEPASELTWTGFFSDAHRYPATQRFLRISSNPQASESGVADNTVTPTSNGVNVGIEGTLYFDLNGEHDTLAEFDGRFGQRTFEGEHPYDGDSGFKKFLNSIVSPVVFANLRKQIANVTCADLISSCALVQNEGNIRAVAQNTGQRNNENIARIEAEINASLARQIEDTLGGPYLVNLHFQIVRVTLPPSLEDAVDQAQAAFAEVSRSQARIETARNEARANRARGRAYRDCGACAQIDAITALKGTSITTWAPGGGFAVTGR
jgi:regulator of protease activity HflC (stomatin/prohibitin superfamily)